LINGPTNQGMLRKLGEDKSLREELLD